MLTSGLAHTIIRGWCIAILQMYRFFLNLYKVDRLFVKKLYLGVATKSIPSLPKLLLYERKQSKTDRDLL